MKIVRVILAGLVTCAALLAGAFAAAVILLTGFIGFVLQLFRVKPAPAASAARSASPRGGSMRTGDVIDVEATQVPPDSPRR